MPTGREMWRAITWAPGYAVSSKGRVRSKRQILKPFDDGRGYLRVTIMGKNRKVHLLVAEAFLPPDPTRPLVDHKNGNKHKNHVDNLERVTHSENTKRAWALGLCGKG